MRPLRRHAAGRCWPWRAIACGGGATAPDRRPGLAVAVAAGLAAGVGGHGGPRGHRRARRGRDRHRGRAARTPPTPRAAVRIEEAAAPGTPRGRHRAVRARPADVVRRRRRLAVRVLWPRTTASGVDERLHVADRLHQRTRGGRTARRRRAAPASPNDARTAVVVRSAEILDDPVAHAVHARGGRRPDRRRARRRDATSLSRERPPSGVVFDARLAPDDPSCGERVRAFARVRTRAEQIMGGEIVYCSRDAARSATVVHEMGHTVGLRHSNDSRDVMFGTFARGRSPRVQPARVRRSSPSMRSGAPATASRTRTAASPASATP